MKHKFYIVISIDITMRVFNWNESIIVNRDGNRTLTSIVTSGVLNLGMIIVNWWEWIVNLNHSVTGETECNCMRRSDSVSVAYKATPTVTCKVCNK